MLREWENNDSGVRKLWAQMNQWVYDGFEVTYQKLGIDFDSKKLELAREFGAETVDLGQGQDPVRIAEHWTNGVGVDGVVITASTKSDELIHQAANMCHLYLLEGGCNHTWISAETAGAEAALPSSGHAPRASK